MSDLFVIRCSQAIFSDAEVEILEDHGKRLERLGDGRQRPVSPAGRRFVEVVKGCFAS